VVVGLGLALLVWGALVLHWDALAKAWDLVVLYVLGSTGGQGAYHALRWRRDRPANDASPGGQDGA
ncbi:MAG: hypothetical protein RMJ05_07555, partial [Thermomicrobium sp.]|nr:hypothetical protein [Thermomicrobium sp.]